MYGGNGHILLKSVDITFLGLVGIDLLLDDDDGGFVGVTDKHIVGVKQKIDEV
jgi:hypothetical protein